MSNLSVQTAGQTHSQITGLHLSPEPFVLSSGTASSAGAASNGAVPQPRLVRAAHEFEAAMMKELMAPLEPGSDPLGEDSDGEGSSSALGSFAGEALGKAISEHGGFGIAKRIISQLTAGSNHSGNSPVPENDVQVLPKNHLNY
jgi:Rod binding domain-containing protein